MSGLTKIPVGTVFRAVAPFWGALIIAVALVILFPDIVLFLPNLMR